MAMVPALGLLVALLSLGTCAFQPLKRLDDRIVGGEAVRIEDYPYQASLLKFGHHLCGASIISAKYLITAAHCTHGSQASSLQIRVGSSIRDAGGVVVPIETTHSHPRFDGTDYDISIVQVANALPPFNSQIGVVLLPFANEALPAGTVSVVTGWGLLKEGGVPSDQLQAVAVPVVDWDTCKKMYQMVGRVTERMICAGLVQGGKDSCQGDSGGPLVANGKLHGIVSWGYGCARPNHPGVYSSVAKLRDFVTQVTGL